MVGQVRRDHNGGVTGDTYSRHARTLSKFLADEADLKKRKKLAEKDAADDGIDVKDMYYVLKNAAQDPQVLIDKQNRITKYFEWSRNPFGKHAGRIPDIDDTLEMTDEERLKYWRDQGFQAGIKASDRSSNPHDLTTPAGQEWDEGWAEGQGKNLSGIRAPGRAQKPANDTAKPRGRKGKASSESPPPPPPGEDEGDETDDSLPETEDPNEGEAEEEAGAQS